MQHFILFHCLSLSLPWDPLLGAGMGAATSHRVASGMSLNLTGQMCPSLPAHPCKALWQLWTKKQCFCLDVALCWVCGKKKNSDNKTGTEFALGVLKKKDEHLKILEEMFSGRLSHVKEGKWKQRGNTPNRNRKEICVLRLPFLCQDFRDAGLHPLTIP